MDHISEQLYNCVDCLATSRIYEEMVREDRNRQSFKFDQAILGPAITMQLRGIRVDQARMKQADQETSDLASGLHSRFEELCPMKVKWGKSIKPSPVQLAKILYGEMGVRIRVSREGSPTVNKEAIASILEDPKTPEEAYRVAEIAQELAVLEEDQKILRKPLREDGRLHTTWVPAGATTGRFVAKQDQYDFGFNLQAFSHRLHKICIPDPGYVLVNIDQKQAESRCLTGDHEVLTPKGWVRLDCLVEGSPVAEWDQGKISMKIPSSIIRLDYSGPLLEIRSRNLSFVCTPDHRIPYLTSIKRKAKAKLAKNLSNWEDIPINGLWQEGKISAILTAKLNAAYLADGSPRADGKAAIFKFRKTRKVDRLLSLLNEGNYRYSHSIKDWASRKQVHVISVFDSPDFMQWGKSAGSYILDWNLETLKSWVNEQQYWDGHKSHEEYDFFDFCSMRTDTLEWVRTASHLVGYAASSRKPDKRDGLGITTICKNRLTSCMSSVTKTTIEFSGKVYCVTVPSSFFLVRHQGCISVTGNCVAFLSNSKKYKEMHFNGNVHVQVGQWLFPEVQWNSKNAKETHLPWDAGKAYYDLFKKVQHSSNYQESAYGMARQLHMKTKDAEILQNKYFKELPEIRNWQMEIAQQLRVYHTLTTPLGRSRLFLGRTWDNSLAKEAIAYVPQSTISQLNKIILWRIWDKFDSHRAQILLEGHDSTTFQVRQGDTETVDEILALSSIMVPIRGDVMPVEMEAQWGYSWGKEDLHDYEGKL